MKKFVIMLLVFVIGKVAYDRIIEEAPVRNADKNMMRIVETMKPKLPHKNEFMVVENVEYSDRVLKFSGTLLEKQELTAPLKSTIQNQLKTQYCSGEAFKNAKVSLEYSFKKVTIPSFDEKLRFDTWSTTIRPTDCT